jgi:integrase
MASVYKRSKRAADGRMVESDTWSVECKTPRGFRRLSAFRDRKASEELGRKVERLSALRTAGERDAELDRWASGLPERLRLWLAKFGVLDARTVASGQSLAAHVADWKADLLARGGTKQHADLSANRVQRVFDVCGVKRWTDLSASAVLGAVSELAFGPKKDADGNDVPGETLSIASKNHHIRALRGFARWMVRDGRANDNPLSHLSIGNAATDKRHERRALEADELRTLLGVTREGPHRFNMTGDARAMLYRVAAETGLRAGELRSLTRCSFVLDGSEPTVSVAAGYSKRRRADTLPLRPGTAADLRTFLAGKLPGAAAFDMPAKGHVAEMLRADLSDAGIAYRDDAGRVCDFHSFRVTTATMLIAGGTDVRTAMDVMRHSTPTLTLGVYAKRLRGSDRDAIANMPDLRSDPAGKTRQRATGTHGRVSGAAAFPTTRTMTEIGGGAGGGKGVGNGGPANTRVCASLPDDGRRNGSGKGPDSLANDANCRVSAGRKLKRPRPDSNRRITDLQSVPVDSQGEQSQAVTSDANDRGRNGGRNDSQNDVPSDPELAALIAAWPTLPDALRAGIAAMVRAAGGVA